MAEATATEQQEWVNRYYSQEQLKDKRRNLLRSCSYAMCRELVRSGGIDQHLDTIANECRQHTDALIDQGHLFTNWRSRGPRGCICSTATCARGRENGSAPQRISPYTDTAVELQRQGPAGQDLQLSRDPRTSALASRENSTLLGPSSTTWWQDTSWPRPAIWRGWPTCRHHSRPRPFTRCDLPGTQRAQMA